MHFMSPPLSARSRHCQAGVLKHDIRTLTRPPAQTPAHRYLVASWTLIITKRITTRPSAAHSMTKMSTPKSSRPAYPVTIVLGTNLQAQDTSTCQNQTADSQTLTTSLLPQYGIGASVWFSKCTSGWEGEKRILQGPRQTPTRTKGSDPSVISTWKSVTKPVLKTKSSRNTRKKPDDLSVPLLKLS